MSRISKDVLEPAYRLMREAWQPFFNAKSIAHCARSLCVLLIAIVFK
ncbi:hypothetical protein Barb7_02917 [Bacteroidales bacterium Barb7]|nr:hypothetical protein Barb7_02917 [Bacteroidales bacterium Barb7]